MEIHALKCSKDSNNDESSDIQPLRKAQANNKLMVDLLQPLTWSQLSSSNVSDAKQFEKYKQVSEENFTSN